MLTVYSHFPSFNFALGETTLDNTVIQYFIVMSGLKVNDTDIFLTISILSLASSLRLVLILSSLSSPVSHTHFFLSNILSSFCPQSFLHCFSIEYACTCLCVGVWKRWFYYKLPTSSSSSLSSSSTLWNNLKWVWRSFACPQQVNRLYRETLL